MTEEKFVRIVVAIWRIYQKPLTPAVRKKLLKLAAKLAGLAA